MTVNVLAQRHAAEIVSLIEPHGYSLFISDKGMIGTHFAIRNGDQHVAIFRQGSSNGMLWRMIDARGRQVGTPAVSIALLTPHVLDHPEIVVSS